MSNEEIKSLVKGTKIIYMDYQGGVAAMLMGNVWTFSNWWVAKDNIMHTDEMYRYKYFQVQELLEINPDHNLGSLYLAEIFDENNPLHIEYSNERKRINDPA